MPAKRKRRKKITRENVKAARARGLSYPQIARDLGISASGAYYAVNPRARGRVGPGVDMKSSSLYLPIKVWDELRMTADDNGFSMSEYARQVLLGEAPVLNMEPRIAGLGKATVMPVEGLEP